MIRLSAIEALKRTDDILIPAPDCVASWRVSVASLRAKAVEAKAALTIEAVPDDKSGGMFGALGDVAGSKLGGMGGALVNAAGDLADKAVDKVGDVAEQGAAAVGSVAGMGFEKILNGLADELEKSIDAFEIPLATISKDITSKKQQELIEVYQTYIDVINVVDPTQVVRGKPTDTVVNGKSAKRWGPEEYNAVPPSSLSKWFNKLSQDDPEKKLEKQLLPVVAEEVAKHDITKRSQDLVDNYNKVVTSEVMAKVGLNFDKVEMDIGPHIVHHTILCLGTFICENEAKFRQNSVDRGGRMPQTFAKIYSGQELFLRDYEFFAAGLVETTPK